MSSKTPNRRSGRQRQPSKRYTVDAFEGLELTGDFEEDALESATVDDAEDDAEFEAGQSPEPEEDEAISVGGGIEDDLQEDASDAGEYDLDDLGDEDSIIGGSDAEHGVTTVRKRHTNGKVKVSKAVRASAQKLYSRGLRDILTRGSKELRSALFWGPAQEDQYPAMQALFKWKNQPVLPSRKADNAGLGGFTKSFYYSETMHKAEVDQDWLWYDIEGGRSVFERRQIMTAMNASQAEAYMPRYSEPLTVLMGPHGSQNPFEISTGGHVDLNEPLEQSGADTSDETIRRYGWMLNVGDKIQCLEWAPNQTGPRQFLAVATMSLHGHDDHEKSTKTHAPAYTPQPARKAAIQIYEVMARRDDHLSEIRAPKLRAVIGTEWGDVKALRWCRAPHKDESTSEDKHRHHLGLLAGVWGDGAVRVLDVSVSDNIDAPTEYTVCNSVAFTAHLPETICTSVDWLSATSIVAGCANGCVGIWNISTCIHHAVLDATPIFFTAIQTTYILAVTSCYPSRPQVILTTSMSGSQSMTDLSEISSARAHSATSTTLGKRTRIARSIIAWHDWSQMVLSVDDNYTLLAFPLRRIFAHTGLTRYPSSCTSIGLSPVHPFVLAGTSAGEAIACNSMRRTFENKAIVWNQQWFTHEWTGDPSSVGGSSESTNVDADTTVTTDPAANATQGLSMADADRAAAQAAENEKTYTKPRGRIRVLESFQPKQGRLQHSDDAYVNRSDNTSYTTVYELESAITQICWNPNIAAGGLVAAGMATGLLRIEDIAM